MSESKIKSAPSLVRVLIVDDSAFVRRVVRDILCRSPFIDVVGVARDGKEALEMTKTLSPDVVTCDLFMPEMDGVEYIRQQMAAKPLPILVLTASPKEGEKVLEALLLGAVDLVRKPSAAANEGLFDIREELLEKVKAAATAPRKTLKTPPQVVQQPFVSHGSLKVDALVIGVSTGGPQALRYLLPLFPANFPIPIAVVLHMPVGYTLMFAEKLNSLCQLKVVEASNGIPFEPGTVLLAAAGHHLILNKSGSKVVAALKSEPLDKPHKPSVDVLFKSAAETFKSRTLGVVLTGMGCDGMEGAGWIKGKGGIVLHETEESAVIYGMPRCVAEAGLSDGGFPLNKMAQAIMKFI
ncbi:MAG: chemotaxis-specific protein-glutamate methyltransferase CheB [Verrucomicrobiales bacterium]